MAESPPSPIVTRRFDALREMLDSKGVLAGTAHKRLAIPKEKLTEGDLKRLGFVSALIAVPEAGQDRFRSFRHPDMNYHLHSHPGFWTMHEDSHPSATMLAHKVRGAKNKAKAYVAGMPHVSEEGLPGLAIYLKGALTGQTSTAQRVLSDLDSETKRKLKRWVNSPTFSKEGAIGTQLQPHQQRVVDRIQRKDQPGLVVAHALGSGKGLTSIAAQDALQMPSTVVAPAALQENYKKEIRKHVIGDAQPVTMATTQRIARSGGKDLVNPLLVVDEIQKAREASSKTYQNLRDDLVPKTEKRLLLTASPFYNRPSDIAPLVNLAAGENVLEADPTRFAQRYIRERQVSPGFFARLRGVQPGSVTELNPGEAKNLKKTFAKWVDHHPGSQEGFPTVERRDVHVPMSKEQLQVYDAMMGEAPAWVAHKVKKGLPPSKQESKDLNAFMGAARQVSNTTRAYTPDQEFHEPKIEAAYQSLAKMLKTNPEARAVVYSNYLQSGIDPYKERLEAAGIPYGQFTGAVKQQDRDQLVRDYNEGLKKVLLLSSAGGEGLDLKGTRLIQLLEPHWNREKIKQVEGRGVRYKSHEHLPEDQRNVLIESYLASRPKRSGVKKLLLGENTGGSADEYLTMLGNDKEKLINQFRALLPQHKEAAAKSPVRGVYKGKPASPDTVKFKTEVHGIPIRVDRPKGFLMMGRDAKGVPWTRRYKYDYGYIPRTLGGDGDGLDVFIGPNKKAGEAYWVLQKKFDGSFDEYKCFLQFDSRQAAKEAYLAHIPKKLFGGMIAMRLGMMKAMLGQNPQDVAKLGAMKAILGLTAG